MGVPDRFQALVDDRSASQAPDAWLDLAEAATAEDAAEALDHLLATDRAVQYLGVLVGGEKAGIASRAHLWHLARAFDDAAGRELPGEPDYELVAWDCPVCSARVWRVHTDPRHPPGCPNGCGPLRPEVV